MKKIAETVRSDVSHSTLHDALRSVGFSTAKDTVISYVSYARGAYLIFSITNGATKFVDRESTPRYYFSDNGYEGEPSKLDQLARGLSPVNLKEKSKNGSTIW